MKLASILIVMTSFLSVAFADDIRLGDSLDKLPAGSTITLPYTITFDIGVTYGASGIQGCHMSLKSGTDVSKGLNLVGPITINVTSADYDDVQFNIYGTSNKKDFYSLSCSTPISTIGGLKAEIENQSVNGTLTLPAIPNE